MHTMEKKKRRALWGCTELLALKADLFTRLPSPALSYVYAPGLWCDCCLPPGSRLMHFTACIPARVQTSPRWDEITKCKIKPIPASKRIFFAEIQRELSTIGSALIWRALLGLLLGSILRATARFCWVNRKKVQGEVGRHRNCILLSVHKVHCPSSIFRPVVRKLYHQYTCIHTYGSERTYTGAVYTSIEL